MGRPNSCDVTAPFSIPVFLLLFNYGQNNNYTDAVKDNCSDIKEIKMLSPGGLDGLCIMTKFLRKYKNNLDPKLEKLITDDFNRAVLYLPLYEQTLSTMSDPLSENLCHNLP